MHTGLAAVVEDVLVVAAGYFEGVGQDGKAVKGSVVVDALGQIDHRAVVPVEPCWVDMNGAEGISVDVTDYISLARTFGSTNMIPDGTGVPRIVTGTTNGSSGVLGTMACASLIVRCGTMGSSSSGI